MQNTGGLYLFRTVCSSSISDDLPHCSYHFSHSGHLPQATFPTTTESFM